MSQENVESAKRGTEAFNRLDLDAYADTCTADYEWYSLLAGSWRNRVFNDHGEALRAAGVSE